MKGDDNFLNLSKINENGFSGEQKSLSGIFRTNNFALGSCALAADHGVFHLCSRLNHSCVPNCEVVWHPNTQTQVVTVILKLLLLSIFIFLQTVVATRPIEMGSEMTICYLNQGDRFSTTKKRREILGKYGFTCMCSACKNEENNGDVFADAYHKLVEDLQATVSIAIKLENYLKIDKVLEQHGSKLIWRIRNLQNAFNLQNENGDRNGSQQISEKLIHLKSILGINCLLWHMQIYNNLYYLIFGTIVNNTVLDGMHWSLQTSQIINENVNWTLKHRNLIPWLCSVVVLQC